MGALRQLGATVMLVICNDGSCWVTGGKAEDWIEAKPIPDTKRWIELEEHKKWQSTNLY
jgi:hypothetical protein